MVRGQNDEENLGNAAESWVNFRQRVYSSFNTCYTKPKGGWVQEFNCTVCAVLACFLN